MSPRRKLFQKIVMIRMPVDLCESLTTLAAKDGRNLSDYCRAALRAHVEGHSVREPQAPYAIPYPATKAEFEDLIRKVVKEQLGKGGKRHGKA
jgi:hypothetical protein